MLLFFIKIYFCFLCVTIAPKYLSAADTTLLSDPTATPATDPAATPAADAAGSAVDPGATNVQLKWPDTSELPDVAVDVVPASATTGINAAYEKTQQAIATMDNAIKEMIEKRTSLYNSFFAQSATADDTVQEKQVAIGSLIELFNPSEKPKE